jgi:hypothetical protein
MQELINTSLFVKFLFKSIENLPFYSSSCIFHDLDLAKNTKPIFQHEYHLQFSPVHSHIVSYARTNQYLTPHQIYFEFHAELAILFTFMVIWRPGLRRSQITSKNCANHPASSIPAPVLVSTPLDRNVSKNESIPNSPSNLFGIPLRTRQYIGVHGDLAPWT